MGVITKAALDTVATLFIAVGSALVPIDKVTGGVFIAIGFAIKAFAEKLYEQGIIVKLKGRRA